MSSRKGFISKLMYFVKFLLFLRKRMYNNDTYTYYSVAVDILTFNYMNKVKSFLQTIKSKQINRLTMTIEFTNNQNLYTKTRRNYLCSRGQSSQ